MPLLGFAFLAGIHIGDAFAEEDQAEAGETETYFNDFGTEADEPDVANDEEDDIARLLTLEGSVALGYENLIPAGNPDARVIDAFASLEAEVALNLSENVRIGAVIVYEPVTDLDLGENRFFGDHGLFAEQLHVEVDIDPVTIQAGKIAPTFGWAADDAAGFYGGEFPGDYELVEQLGVSARISLREALRSRDRTIKHALSAALFTADTSFLSGSIFTHRDILDVSDGGVGNTGSLKSFAIAYLIQTRDGDDELVGPSFQTAIRRLARGQDDERGEWGFLAAFEDRYVLGYGVSLSPIVEAAYFTDSDGGEGDIFSATIGCELAAGQWRASSNFSRRDSIGDDERRDYAITAGVGRIFDIPRLGEIRADIAYMFAGEDTAGTHVIGVQIEREFSIRLPRPRRPG